MRAARPRRWTILVFVLGLLLIVPFFACDREHLVLDEAARRGLAGAFTPLPDGVVHYELAGPANGPRVVLIHGASGPMAVWDPTVAALAGAGFRVLRYDLFGRGYSDRPRVTYDQALFERQLTGLLAAVGWTAPVDLIGSSMGAVIAAGFTAGHPGVIGKVALIGPAGFPIEATAAAKLLPVPLLGDYAITVLGDRMLPAHNRKYYFEPDKFPKAHEQFKEQLDYKGYKAAILSTLRHMPLNDFAAGYRALDAQKKPVLLLWGREDRTFPFSNFEAAKALMPGAEAVPIDAAAHVPQTERPEIVNARLIQFLKGGG